MTDKLSDAGTQGADSAPPAAEMPPDIIYLPDDRQRTKKVTSGSENRRRHNFERFRTDDVEHDALHERLRASGFGLGEYVMQLAQIESGKFSRPRKRGRAAVDDVALTRAVAAFNRVGNNHNQTTRALNELALIAREKGASWLESQIMALAEAIRGMPAQFAEPVAAIMAALNPDGGDA
jgi:hypothetical protein